MSVEQTPCPTDWSVTTLEEISGFITKGATPTTYGFDWATKDNGIPFLRSECVTQDGFNEKGMNFISDEAHDAMERSQVKSGDLLMTITGNIGRVAKLPMSLPEANINQHIAKISLKDESDTNFILQVLKQDKYVSYYQKILTGQAYPQISLKQVRETPVALPPRDEREKISLILSRADKKVDLIEQKISETQQLKKGLMQKLFYDGVGEISEKGEWLPHTEFQDSVYGSIPAVWAISQLNEVLSYVDYRGKTPPKVESGVFLVTAKNVKNGYIDYEASKEYIPKALYDEVMSRGTPKLGDVLFTTEAPMGNIALVDNQDVAIAQRIIKFRPKSWRQLNNVYLKYFFLSPAFKKELDFNGTGSTVKGIKGKRLHVMKIAIPPIKEQIKIARILSTVDKKIDLLNQQKAEAQRLKKGLMQKLLTGEWRVPLDDQAA